MLVTDFRTRVFWLETLEDNLINGVKALKERDITFTCEEFDHH